MAGSLDMEISGLNYNSKNIKEGDLFVAIKGLKTDGHKYIASALEKGAAALVVEEIPGGLPEGVAVIKVADSRNSLAKLAVNFYGNPSSELGLIGITGTNGKTTTSYLIKSIFEAAGHKVGVIGTIGNQIGDRFIETGVTTPESLELQQSFRMMMDEGIDTAIMEVSSHALELDRVSYSKFDVGIFSNLSVDHLDYHGNLENYLKAKKKLFYMTGRANVINGDDPYGREIIEEIKDLDTRLITYGIGEGHDICADSVELHVEGVEFRLVTPEGSIDIKANTPGLFTVYNCLAAASAAYVEGVSLEDIRKGLESNRGVKGRFEIVPVEGDFTVIIDFAHTPDALEKVLKSAREFAKGRVVAVFGAGGDRDNSKRATMGEIAGTYADFSFVTSDNPRTEKPEAIIADILEGMKRTAGEYEVIVDRKEAIEHAVRNAQKDDVIILAGKGHETYIILGETKYPFDERQIAIDALK